ncbi:hypothetical protein FHQ28_05350 [Pasteurellaceae bacterium USgator11]|nr:hypothetical protein FHQ19_09450 [Pasteurellaceae bacterium UScroc12]TNG94741.1 hypothetical protein FHQ20_08090 [Pasteurellaceae bacterium USgator41]TNG97712.1 hypothetical protein FHQ24_09880 [Pasteurellaceae bacterium UScroc31]TNH01673.1 hypothetical protein FHQ28_05350 [Pasteurellaceae bacterium USgator11]
METITISKSEYDELLKDKERLDFIQSVNLNIKTDRGYFVARESHLPEICAFTQSYLVRKAIDNAIKEFDDD